MRAFCERARFFVKCLFLFALLGLAIGCGKKEGTVSGKVYYKGQVLKAGTVRFFPEGKGGGVGADIKEDGSYSISKVPPGPAKISIETANPDPPMPMMGGPGGRGGGMAMEGMKKQKEKMQSEKKGEGPTPASRSVEKVKLPEKYSDPEQSGLKVEVTGGKQNHDVKID